MGFVKVENIKVSVLLLTALVAIGTRLFSIVRFESVIHEFDPWFNYRATEYLIENGFRKFLNWFDDKSWYPLGRLVGVTVYPGLMLTSAALHWILNSVLAIGVSTKDICVFLAPGFSALTSFATYLLTSEVKDSSAGLLAAIFMAVAPGYVSRSVAGSYDNEAIAIFILVTTFYFWIRAVKYGSVQDSCLAALFYFYMSSAWVDTFL